MLNAHRILGQLIEKQLLTDSSMLLEVEGLNKAITSLTKHNVDLSRKLNDQLEGHKVFIQTIENQDKEIKMLRDSLSKIYMNIASLLI